MRILLLNFTLLTFLPAFSQLDNQEIRDLKGGRVVNDNSKQFQHASKPPKAPGT